MYVLVVSSIIDALLLYVAFSQRCEADRTLPDLKNPLFFTLWSFGVVTGLDRRYKQVKKCDLSCSFVYQERQYAAFGIWHVRCLPWCIFVEARIAIYSFLETVDSFEIFDLHGCLVPLERQLSLHLET